MTEGDAHPPGTWALEDAEDVRLLARLKDGDEHAFAGLYERYRPRFHAYALAALGDAHQAEDVAHEVFVEMLRSLATYKIGGAPFRVWLFRVLRNRVKAQIARNRRWLPLDPSELGERADELAPLESEIFERLEQEDFLAMIERLSEPQRRVLALRFLFDFDLDEIARILATTPNAAANLQHRALETLRARLAGVDDGPTGTQTTHPMRTARPERRPAPYVPMLSPWIPARARWI